MRIRTGNVQKVSTKVNKVFKEIENNNMNILPGTKKKKAKAPKKKEEIISTHI